MTWHDPNWSTAVEWNASLEDREEREPKERDYLWPSELGKAPIDVFLRMRGVKETNPPNGRSKRKFEAGNYMEWLVSLVYFRAGILKTQQQRIEHQYPGLLRVSGKSDFLVGGLPDYTEWERTEALMRELGMPDFIFRTANAIRESLAKKYPDGLMEKFIEIKSCAGIMFDNMERKATQPDGKVVWKGQAGHRKQLFHYLKGANYPNGDLVYIDKDSLRMAEVPITNPGPVEDEYKETIQRLTDVYNAGKDIPVEEFIESIVEEGTDRPVFHWREGLPQPEPLIIWNADLGKFSKNFNVEYSGYLSMLYGFAQPSEYDEQIKPFVSQWNTVLKRIKTAKARQKWLDSYGKNENDVSSELRVIEGRKNRVRFHFIVHNGEVTEIPKELCSGFELKEEHVAVLNVIAEKGFDINALLDEFTDGDEGEEEE